jgi:antitoxin ParD1/3/4
LAEFAKGYRLGRRWTMPKREWNERSTGGATQGARKAGAVAGRGGAGDAGSANPGSSKGGRAKASKAKPATVNISMPAGLRDRVVQRVRDGSFGNVSEYFRHLVREDLRTLARLEELLLEGLESGKPEEMSETWIERRRVAARAAGELAARKRVRKAG